MTAPVAFDVWARDEIARLRREADALEQALSRYTEAVAGGRHGPPVNAAAVPVHPPRVRLAIHPRPRGSKYDPLFQRWAEASGKSGLTLDEMARIADEAGSPVERNNLRSLVFNQRKAGRVVVSGDRYIWKSQEASAPEGTDALL